MFCPRCGQQQSSGDLRFCSRCGLPLGIVSEVLANGGTLPQLLDLEKKSLFTKVNGAIFSLFWFIFFTIMMTSFWGILGVDELAGISAIIGIFGGFMILLFSLFFLKKSKPNYPQIRQPIESYAPAGLYGNQSQNALPPQQSIPVSDYMSPQGNWRAPDTDDLTRQGSVTEGTTRLLKNDD